MEQAVQEVKGFFELIVRMIEIIYKNILKSHKKFQEENTLKVIVDQAVFNKKFMIIATLIQLIELSMQDEIYRFYILM